MMTALRGQVAKWIFGFLLVAFIAWIVLELGMQGKVGTATGAMAKVNGDTVAGQEFWTTYNQEVENNWGAMRGVMNEADEKGLRMEVLEKLVDRVLSWQESKRLKYAVSRKDVQLGLRSYPAFQNQQGQFDPTRYAAVLNRLGLSQETFEADQERSQSAGRIEGMIREAVRTTDDEMWLEYLRLHRRMQADVAALPFSEARAKIKVTPDEVKAYWGENRRNYEKAERVRIRHIVAAVNPQGGPEALAQARAKIDSIVAELKKGGDFADLAKRKSDDGNTQPRGGDLGWHPRGELIPEYDQVAFKLRKGQVSAVFQTKFGFHLLKCDEHQQEEKPTFEQKREEIRKLLLDARARERMVESAQKLMWALRREKDLRKACTEAGRPAPASMWLEKGKTLPGGVLPTAKTVDAVVGAIGPLEPGEVTTLVETADGFYVAQLKEEQHKRAPEKGFLKERAEVEASLLARKQKAAVDSWLAGLRAKGKVKLYLEN